MGMKCMEGVWHVLMARSHVKVTLMRLSDFEIPLQDVEEVLATEGTLNVGA